MAITPADIEQLAFTPSKHGYDTKEVDAFLEELAVEVDAMLQKIADLKGRLTASDQALDAARSQIAQLQQELQEQGQSSSPSLLAVSQPSGSMASERQISQALIVAQKAADRMISEARDNADKIKNDADQKAREVIRQALAEKQNELDEIDRLKASREEFRTEYKQLLQHFMDDAESVFPSQMLTTPAGSAPRYDAPVAAESVDVNATVYAPVAPANMDDLD